MSEVSHDHDLLGSRDVIDHVTVRLPGVEFLWVVHSDMRLSGTVTEIERLKDNKVTSLTF